MTKPSTANGGYPSVVVTAVAATTSLAPDIESTWKGLLAGESGIRVLEDDFVYKWDLPVKIGGHLKEPVDIHMGRLDMRRMSYVQRLSKYLSGQLWETPRAARNSIPTGSAWSSGPVWAAPSGSSRAMT